MPAHSAVSNQPLNFLYIHGAVFQHSILLSIKNKMPVNIDWPGMEIRISRLFGLAFLLNEVVQNLRHFAVFTLNNVLAVYRHRRHAGQLIALR